jgi:hypothetical protein
MALFADGTISTVDDLQAYDTSIVSIASAEEVQLNAKIGLAKSEIGIELEELLEKRTSATRWAGAGVGLKNVVVTPALKHWHSLLTLALVYGDIKGNHLESRYGQKWQDYLKRARWAANSLWRSGIGVVSSPISRAERPSVRTVPAVAPMQTYWIQVSWRTSSNDSSEPSEMVIHTAESDGVPAVMAGPAPPMTVGYDVFVGLDPDAMKKQNSTVLPVGTEWTMPVGGMIDGEAPTDGQEPERFIRNDRILMRG